MKTLVILSSILGNRSHSKELADHFIARVKTAHSADSVKIRDIGAQPIPYFDGSTAGALFTPAQARSVEQQRIVELSDSLVAELMQADRIVFAVPVYNFNLPAQFKSYLDHVARAGVTFRYTPEGVPEGLVKGKQVFVLTARGGKAEGTPSDTMTPYLRQMLSFLGMDDVTFIAAEGMAMGEVAALEGVTLAKQRIDALALDAVPDSLAA
ncbi:MULTISPECIES: FMN-dependent NADH-azoreductase [Achromobacter]|uniref:FMN dependent NADH:quinone oxidoreductase n=1 Tax=Achromobacter spanius TaxID=217203 RepID=A0ABY8GR75_9BURK|nr:MULTISPECIES: NAD(P)H-dependent oxidoreductase [Achromobacter]WAI83519.1 NAD(P)H-dependent oxidoreductase [Achromobacter spanius]WEX93603.1 NAD(P)H-dependent oxidoreductase [Achromobacter sp. SS2-2022]WFP07236.1 NAD(P)H-dependent oxidoreductase [Achromobacter spanius]